MLPRSCEGPSQVILLHFGLPGPGLPKTLRCPLVAPLISVKDSCHRDELAEKADNLLEELVATCVTSGWLRGTLLIAHAEKGDDLFPQPMQYRCTHARICA